MGDIASPIIAGIGAVHLYASALSSLHAMAALMMINQSEETVFFFHHINTVCLYLSLNYYKQEVQQASRPGQPQDDVHASGGE